MKKALNRLIILWALLLFLLADLYSQTYLEKKEFNKIIKLYRQKKYKDALRGFKIFKEKYPSSYYLPDIYYYIAILEEDYYSSILAFKELLVKFPEYKKADEALYKLGKLYFLHNNYTEAIRIFEHLQDNYPKSDFIYGSNYWLGITHLIKRNYSTAIEYFNRVLNYNKKDRFYILALIGKANTYFEKRNYKKSIKFYKTALKLKNKNYFPQIYVGIGNSYIKMKNYRKAYYYYKKILKEFKGTPEYEIALRKIKFMESNRTIFDKLNVKRIFPQKGEKKKKRRKYYTVQLSSVKNKRYANNLRIKLKVHGYNAFMRTVNTDKGKFYRTMVGKFKNKKEAINLRNEIKHKFKINGIIAKIEL